MEEKSTAVGGDIVAAILRDLTGRRGLRQGWEEIDEETQLQIVAEWERLAAEALRSAGAAESADLRLQWKKKLEKLGTQIVDEAEKDVRELNQPRLREGLEAFGTVLKLLDDVDGKPRELGGVYNGHARGRHGLMEGTMDQPTKEDLAAWREDMARVEANGDRRLMIWCGAIAVVLWISVVSAHVTHARLLAAFLTGVGVAVLVFLVGLAWRSARR